MDNLNELKTMPIWVCWNKVEKSGRMTKVPCSAAGGRTGTNEEYRDTWVRYDEAVNAAQKYMYSGVGFVIPEGWFFLDIDRKELSDTLVQEILSRFDTYAEYSQSGAGLHLYGKCDFNRLPTETLDGKRRLDHRYYKRSPITSPALLRNSVQKKPITISCKRCVTKRTRRSPADCITSCRCE